MAALGAAGVAAVVTVVVGVAGAAVARRGLAPARAVLAVPEIGVKIFSVTNLCVPSVAWFGSQY